MTQKMTYPLRAMSAVLGFFVAALWLVLGR